MLIIKLNSSGLTFFFSSPDPSLPLPSPTPPFQLHITVSPRNQMSTGAGLSLAFGSLVKGTHIESLMYFFFLSDASLGESSLRMEVMNTA